MTKQQEATYTTADPDDMGARFADIAKRSQKIIEDFLSNQAAASVEELGDARHIADAFLALTTRLAADQSHLFQAQMELWNDYLRLWQHSAERLMGRETAPVIAPEAGDRRFRHADWNENVVFDFVKQSYLLTARWMQGLVQDVEGLDEKTAKKVDFYTRQFVDAMAPTNFLLTNPEVLRATAETKGENLLKGLSNLLSDLERGKGRLSIAMTDHAAFEIGKNIALSPGKVIYQTDLMQLIQYDPKTPTVHQRPLLIMPPWINKYYILDLRPDNSFIRWATEQGLTVFVISWVNPDTDLAKKSFTNYMVEGPLAALDAIEKATGEREVNAIGYCLGGTLLAATLAYMAAKKDNRIASATYFASLIDFSEPGEIEVFIDEEQLATLERRMNKRGYLAGHEMATTFNMLRANDLIWSFVVNNYLLGKDPFPFDLLYWNSDSTRMPAAMHSFYLRNMYQENKLVRPGGIRLKNVPIDLRRISIPTYVLSTREDHIAPWKSTYVATQTYSGDIRFVLAGSGHIAGIINPPTQTKYGYWTNENIKESADDWLAGAKGHEGSWWLDWKGWILPLSGKNVPARKPGDGKLKVLEDAPGSYAFVSAS